MKLKSVNKTREFYPHCPSTDLHVHCNRFPAANNLSAAALETMGATAAVIVPSLGAWAAAVWVAACSWQQQRSLTQSSARCEGDPALPWVVPHNVKCWLGVGLLGLFGLLAPGPTGTRRHGDYKTAL